MSVPERPKIYHIVHIDRLASIIQNRGLWCDAKMVQHSGLGTTVGMNKIKQRRLEKTLNSYSDLHVGDCVPFYFCPRSIMLYIISQANHPDLSYQGGQEPIIHLQADLYNAVNWANQHLRRWAFTLSNAGACYCEERNKLADLKDINWAAVQSTDWQPCKEGKQAEFLVEQYFSWKLIEKVGVQSQAMYNKVWNLIYSWQPKYTLPFYWHCPSIDLQQYWYY